VRAAATLLLIAALAATGCEADRPRPEAAPVPGPVAGAPADVPPEIKDMAEAQFADAIRRIDEELLRARLLRAEDRIAMLRYRRAFAAIVRERLAAGGYRIVPIVPGHPPESDERVLRTYGAAFEADGRQWAALIEVERSDNPELFELLAALDVGAQGG